MNQLTIFDGELPEVGDTIQTNDGKIKIIDYRTAWGIGEQLILWNEKGYLKACPPSEFKELFL